MLSTITIDDIGKLGTCFQLVQDTKKGIENHPESILIELKNQLEADGYHDIEID